MIHNILIVDDEPFQCNGLKDIISVKRPGVHIDTARNGRQALEKLQGRRPDIVMTDIRMPGMDGLQLAENVQQNYPGIKIVLISAYQEFEYAKQALKFGVFDYLLKPYKADEIENMMSRFEKADRNGANQAGSSSHREMLVHKLLEGNLTEPETGELKAETYTEGPGFIANGVFLLPPSGKADRSCFGNVLQQVVHWVEDRGKGILTDVSHYEQSGAQFVLPGMTDARAADLMADLCRYICASFSLDFFVGISENRASLLKNAKEAAEHAVEAQSFQFYEPSGCMAYPQVANALSMTFPSLNTWRQRLVEAVNHCDREALHGTTGEIVDFFSKPPYYYPKMVKHRISGMVISVFDSFEKQLAPADFEQLQNEAYMGIYKAQSIKALMNACKTVLITAATLIRNHGRPTRERFVGDCLKWVEDNINQEITLMEAAEHFHFNPCYFSSMIKQKTGMSYGQYILELRMEKARKLLKDSKKKVQAIALEVGYHDPCYFNRIFKRENNMTPEQYRRAHMK